MSMRITGMVTGMDTDQMVKDLMKAHRYKVTNMQKRQTTFEWQRDMYRELNTKLTEFRNDKLFNFKLESTFNAKTISLVGDSKAISAKATANAMDGSLTIKVDRLATAASNFSEGAVAKDGFNLNETLASQAGNLTYDGDLADSYTFKINGTTIRIDPTKMTMREVVAEINAKTNVTAFYDEATKKMSFSAKNTGVTNGADGKGAYITFEDISGDFLSGIMQVTTDGDNRVAGVDAEVTINGLSTTRSSNTFVVNGIEITLQEAGGAAVTLEPKTDTDKIVEAVKQFIDDYNGILQTLNDKLSEKKERDYAPLTDEEREALSEKQIELWEEKAKSGLLRNDAILSKIVGNLRFDATAVVNTGFSEYNALSTIGIDTGDYSEKGKLYLESEEKLRAAIEANPEAVKALFTGDGAEGSVGSDVGILERMYSNLKSGLDELTAKAGLANVIYDDSDISERISDLASEIDRENRRLAKLEENYYRRFAIMETTINRYNQQAIYLQNQFGSKV